MVASQQEQAKVPRVVTDSIENLFIVIFLTVSLVCVRCTVSLVLVTKASFHVVDVVANGCIGIGLLIDKITYIL